MVNNTFDRIENLEKDKNYYKNLARKRQTQLTNLTRKHDELRTEYTQLRHASTLYACTSLSVFTVSTLIILYHKFI